MRVLVIKTSSLGDVIHTLPAITDAAAALPGVRFDWVVEESFAEVPDWHDAVERVIPVALRRWRRHPLRTLLGAEWRGFRRRLRAHEYDRVVDAQGLIKSAWLARKAHGRRAGLDRRSAREPLASLAYHARYAVARDLHAITRVRQLFAQALGYSMPAGEPDYGIRRSRFQYTPPPRPYVVFLHGSAWTTKQWPEQYWQALAQRANEAGYQVRVPQGNDDERARAERIIADAPDALVLSKGSLTDMATELANARGVVGVDTGLAHLAAALGVPAVTLYGPTRPGLTGTWGTAQQTLCADFPCAPCLRRECRYTGEASVWPACFASLPAERVWEALGCLLADVDGAGTIDTQLHER